MFGGTTESATMKTSAILRLANAMTVVGYAACGVISAVLLGIVIFGADVTRGNSRHMVHGTLRGIDSDRGIAAAWAIAGALVGLAGRIIIKTETDRQNRKRSPVYWARMRDLRR